MKGLTPRRGEVWIVNYNHHVMEKVSEAVRVSLDV